MFQHLIVDAVQSWCFVVTQRGYCIVQFFIVNVDRVVGPELLDCSFTFCIFGLLDLFGFPLRRSWWETWSGVIVYEVVGLGLPLSLDNVCQPFLLLLG